MKYIFSTIIFILSVSGIAYGQQMSPVEIMEKIQREGGGYMRLRINENGDSLLFVEMKPVIIFPRRVFKSKREKRRYYRLVRNVKKAYPYSLTIKKIFIESEFVLRNMDNNRQRKRYVKEKERELKKEFEDDIRDMTYSQGRILIKLVDRETSHTSYELVKHFKGKVTAFFWQGVARLFSTNLKYEYDPDGTDRWIEEIVVQIENGQL